MSAFPFFVSLSVVSLLVALLHWHYGNWRRHNTSVTLITLLAWTLPFLIIFTLPTDVSVTFYNQCLLDHNLTDHTTLATLPTTLPILTTQPSTYHSSNLSLLLLTRSSLIPNNFTTPPFTTLNPPSIKTPSSSPPLPTSTTQNPPPPSSASPPTTPHHGYMVCVKPWTYIPASSLSVLWHVVYWTSQCLTWIWLPMMQSYAKAGEFTFLGKLRYALLINGIYYGTYLSIFTCCLIYLAASSRLTFNLGQLKVLAITASNTWGLTLLVLLLGYGLVELPRSCWNAANIEKRLKLLHFKVAKLTMQKIEAEEELEDVVMEVNRVSAVMSDSNPLRKNMDVVVRLCNDVTQSGNQTSTQTHTSTPANFDRTEESELGVKVLVKLHRRLIFAKQAQSSKQCQWAKVISSTILSQDILENIQSGLKMFHRSAALGAYSGPLCHSPSIEWYWRCKLQPLLLKSLAVSTGVFSLMVVWSECLFFVRSPVLSLFAQFAHLAQLASGYHAIELVSIVTVSYLSVCTYFSIFRLKIFSYYSLVGPHETDQNSMVFCGMLLCRLTPPLCLNFLGLIHLDSHVTNNVNMVETSYTRFMGNLVVLPFIASGFNIYFPIAIVILCSLTLFGIGARVLHCLGFQQFIGDDEMTQEMVDEGVELVKRERRKLTRHEDAEARKREWSERAKESLPQARRIGIRKGNDRSELLNDAEPMAYRSYDDSSNSVLNNQHSLNNDTYQQHANNNSRSDDSTQVVGGANRTFVRPNAAPPRNLFDDV